MEQTIAPAPLTYEPNPLFSLTPLQDDSALADCKGKRIGILIVTYNAVGTILKVLKRITPNVWSNVEEVVVLMMPARTPLTNWRWALAKASSRPDSKWEATTLQVSIHYPNNPAERA